MDSVAKVLAGCVPVPHPRFDRPCLIWQGATSSAGYGLLRVDGRVVSTHSVIAGPAPPGFDRDHLCGRTLCCERTHIEIVTHAENVRRGKAATKTACKHGHPYTPENTIERRRTSGALYRTCRTCKRQRDRRAS